MSPNVPPRAISPRQEKFLEALLQSTGIVEAARVAGINRRTATRMLADPSFRSAYQAARRESLDLTSARIASLSGEAVDAIAKILRSGSAPASVRLGAAKAVLDLAVKIGDADLEDRLSALEAAAHQA